MIKYVTNGNYRSKSIVIKSFLNGIEINDNGFPIVENITQSFPGFNQLTDEQLISLSNIEYTQRVEQFKLFLLSKYNFLKPNSFNGQPSGYDTNICENGNVIGQSEIVIDTTTKITIFFDSSGSMSQTHTPLVTMRNTLLKNTLLRFYNNNESLFNEMVKVISDPNERTFEMLANRNDGIQGKHLIMVFQDESYPSYHSYESHQYRSVKYEQDITLLRQRLSTLQPNTYRGVIFQVNNPAADGVVFKSLIKSVEKGIGEYAPPWGLSDKPEFAFEYDVINGSTPQYYMDLILIKMRQLGFRI